ncbi:MAG: TIGR03086 family protein [Kutzneria sp.]|nr:TIGR03086 family protein [Kutzneria sp.]MBV9847228.1 TIGR03086 family protein [Kutzneria sp.]
MRAHTLITAAATPTIEIVRNIADAQLEAPTPCTEYTVRKLVNHLLFWGPWLVGAAVKQSVSLPAESDKDVDLVGPDWAKDLEEQIEHVVAAWSEPAAWEGATGQPEMPAAMVGGMVCDELILHGWDLARATGQEVGWNEEILTFAHQEVSATAKMGRDMGMYGPEVDVPSSASTLDRMLGLSGRDPNWKP